MKNIPYEGGAFHSGFSSGKAFGKITVTVNSLNFETQGFTAELPLKGLLIKRGGAGNRMIFFTHASVPGLSVYTSDDSVLNDVNLTVPSGITRQITQIQRERKRSKVFVIAFVTLCLACIYGFFTLKEPLLVAIAKRIPATWEQNLGDAAFSQLRSGKHFVDDPEFLDKLEQITIPLLSRIREKRYSFTVHVIEDPTVNAFALPGGHIVLNTGLLLSAKSPEEVAGVLAHEVAHITLQHGVRQLIGSAGIYALVQTFFGDTTGLMAVIVENSSFLLTRKYSRDYEREADDNAWLYLVNAGINPKGMLVFFERLLEEQEKRAEKCLLTSVENSLSFLSTHPTTRERIEYLYRKLKKQRQRSRYISFNLDFRKFQDIIRTKTKKSQNEGLL